MKYEQELALGSLAADKAGRNAVEIRAAGFTTEYKTDHSPVTAADRSNERIIRNMIAAHFPNDGITGEEGGQTLGTTNRHWIVDPLDSTKGYTRGSRFWSILIALQEGGEIVMGLAHFPMLAETYWAVRGEGAYCNGERIRVSQTQHVRDAVLCPSSLNGPALQPYAADLLTFMCQFDGIQCPSGALGAAMLAAGQIDVWFKGRGEKWDLAALQVIIEEAGGSYFALDGTRSTEAGHAIACAPALEHDVRAFLRVPGKENS